MNWKKIVNSHNLDKIDDDDVNDGLYFGQDLTGTVFSLNLVGISRTKTIERTLFISYYLKFTRHALYKHIYNNNNIIHTFNIKVLHARIKLHDFEQIYYNLIIQ